MRRLTALGVLLAALVPLLTGCVYLQLLAGSASSGSGEAQSSVAQSRVRAAIPAVEAWYADHDTYAGLTLANLRQQYDPQVEYVTFVGPLNRNTYCVESTVGGTSYFKAGPAAEILEGHCGDRVVPPPPPAPPSFDAQTRVRMAVPAIEAWNGDYGTYAGMTIAKLRAKYDYGIPATLEVVRATKTTYCIESTVTAETWSYRGPAGPLARGRC